MPALLQTLQGEKQAGSAALRRLVVRAVQGELQGKGTRVDLGSLDLVGNRAAGLVAPTVMLARGAELIEEDDEQVLVRIDGDPSQPALAGGLFFGVHRLRKVMRIAVAAARADLHLADGEALVLSAARRFWGISAEEEDGDRITDDRQTA